MYLQILEDVNIRVLTDIIDSHYEYDESHIYYALRVHQYLGQHFLRH